jgi:hypothetical protein
MEFFYEFKEYITDVYNYYYFILFIKGKYDHKILIKDIVDEDEINKIINEAHLDIKLDKELQVLEKRFSLLKEEKDDENNDNNNNNNNNNNNALKVKKKICLL